MNQEQMVFALLFTGRHLMYTVAGQLPAEVDGMTGPDLILLIALRAFPSSTQSQLTAILGRDKTTLSRTLTRLERDGFVTARMNPIDGRQRTLELTEKATGPTVAAIDSMKTVLGQVVASMTPEEEKACLRFIDRLTKELLVA